MRRNLRYGDEDIVMRNRDGLHMRHAHVRIHAQISEENLQTFGGPVVPDEKHKNAIRRRLSPDPNCVRRSPSTSCLSDAAVMT